MSPCTLRAGFGADTGRQVRHGVPGIRRRERRQHDGWSTGALLEIACAVPQDLHPKSSCGRVPITEIACMCRVVGACIAKGRVRSRTPAWEEGNCLPQLKGEGGGTTYSACGMSDTLKRSLAVFVQFHAGLCAWFGYKGRRGDELRDHSYRPLQRQQASHATGRLLRKNANLVHSCQNLRQVGRFDKFDRQSESNKAEQPCSRLQVDQNRINHDEYLSTVQAFEISNRFRV